MILLDEFDCKILTVLQENARVTTQELADRIGLSATPCARRVKRLEESGLIAGYVALLDPCHLDLNLTVFVNVRLNAQSSKAFDVFESAIKKFSEVVGCYLLAGNYDYLLEIRVANVDAFKRFIRDQLAIMDEVAETHSSIVLEETKHTTAFRVRPTTTHQKAMAQG